MSQISALQAYFFGSKDCNDTTIDSDDTTIEHESWQKIGHVDDLKKQHCRRLYAESKKNDVALYYVKGKFYATNATCPHAGGPLDQVEDIEDLNNLEAVCPWHLISFNIETGESCSGYQVKTREINIIDDDLYVKHEDRLSLTER